MKSLYNRMIEAHCVAVKRIIVSLYEDETYILKKIQKKYCLTNECVARIKSQSEFSEEFIKCIKDYHKRVFDINEVK